MPTIKGPIHMKGFNAGKFLEEHAKDVKVKLPFTATGWKSSKTPKIADMSQIKTAKENPKEVEKKEEPKKEDKPKPKDFRQELIDLKGVGEKITDQILRLAKTKEELAKTPRQVLVDALRDDVVPILDKYLGRK